MARLNVGRSQVFSLFQPDESGQPPLRSVKIGRRRLVPELALVDFISRLDQQAADTSVQATGPTTDSDPYRLSDVLVAEVDQLARRHGKRLVVDNPDNSAAGPVYRLVDK
jgi:hypothetical protein